ncbi:MAG: hypothetical protein M5U13_00885 [Thermoanaerobaculia bacterium]|nr:hypothetical protein [Thermoanaerobaculia bacterium]
MKLKKVVLSTAVVVLTAYVVYAILIVASVWVPRLPTPPKLPILDPQDALAWFLPTDVSKRLEEIRKRPEELLTAAETRARNEAEKAKRAAEDVAKKLEEERKRRERDLGNALPKP